MSPLFFVCRRKVIVMAAQPVHIDINQQIQDWKNARYGRQVRSANVEALTELQNQMNGAVDYLVEKGEAVDQAAKDVQLVRQEAQAPLTMPMRLQRNIAVCRYEVGGNHGAAAAG